jgi:tRNA pseudouridine55 synthase
LSGGLLVAKPAGMTSHDVVAIVRRRLRVDSVGHTGTLDPFATGLLVVLLGSATRLGRFVATDPKRYRAEAQLGVATTTDDATGRPLGTPWTGPWPSRERVEAALGEMVGLVPQRPPAFSAKKVGGERSYRLARRAGLAAVPLEPVSVRIDELRVEEYQPPRLVFVAQVGTGTYLRSIARDLGERLGTGAHLRGLERSQVGPFRLEDAVSLDRVEPSAPRLSVSDLLGGMPRVAVNDEEAAAIRHGRVVGAAAEDAVPSALMLGEEVVAIGCPDHGRWQPTVVLRRGEGGGGA